VNGHVIEIPGEVEGLIILNVPFYAGGAEIWGPLALEDFDVNSKVYFCFCYAYLVYF
jgi:hypothetical protein